MPISCWTSAAALEYEYLLEQAEQRLQRSAALYAASPLPERPDEGKISQLLGELREEWYGGA